MLALGCALCFAALAVWARLASPAPWEPSLMTAIALQPGIAGDVIAAINTIGNPPLWAIVIALTAVAAALIRGVVAAALVVVSFASDIAAFAVKLLVERERPETAVVEQFFGIDSFAFPSGHVVRAVALVAVLVWLFGSPGWRLPGAVAGALGAAAVMGYARVSLGVHWPTDAVGGLLLGAGWFAFTAWIAVKRNGLNAVNENEARGR
jgi:undecaprenyl-diphosphatase